MLSLTLPLVSAWRDLLLLSDWRLKRRQTGDQGRFYFGAHSRAHFGNTWNCSRPRKDHEKSVFKVVTKYIENRHPTLNVFHEQEGTGSATAGDWVLVNKVWSGAGAILKSVWMCKINIWHPDTAQGEYCTRLEEGIATVQSNSGNYFSFMIVKLWHLWPLSHPPYVISKTVAFVTLNAILYFLFSLSHPFFIWLNNPQG